MAQAKHSGNSGGGDVGGLRRRGRRGWHRQPNGDSGANGHAGCHRDVPGDGHSHGGAIGWHSYRPGAGGNAAAPVADAAAPTPTPEPTEEIRQPVWTVSQVSNEAAVDIVLDDGLGHTLHRRLSGPGGRASGRTGACSSPRTWMRMALGTS